MILDAADALVYVGVQPGPAVVNESIWTKFTVGTFVECGAGDRYLSSTSSYLLFLLVVLNGFLPELRSSE